MTFLRPEFLNGLFAIAIPLIIHLFNFRRHKKLYFSDISRLKTITTNTRKKQKLKHLVVLALRILSILFIVLALAGPIPNQQVGSNVQSSKILTIYVDNSYSMLSEGINGRLFESARQEALNIINQNPDNANFIILSNSAVVSNMRLLDKEAAISAIEEMNVSSDAKETSQLINERNRILSKTNQKGNTTYLISDFQSNSTDIENIASDTISNYIFLPLTHLNNKNIYISDCEIDSPEMLAGKVIDISVNIKNDSDTDYEKVPVKLILNDQQKAVVGVDIPAGNTRKVNLNFTVSEPGWYNGVVEVEDFPITFDDKLNFALQVVPNIEILILGNNGKNNYLGQFYSSDEVFSVKVMDFRSIDVNKLRNNDLIILNSIPNISSGLIIQLEQTIMDGGNVLYIPPGEENIDNIELFLTKLNIGSTSGIDTTSTRVTRLKLSSPLFAESIVSIPQNAELPTINKHYKYSFPANSGVETLASLLSGDDFLSKKDIGSGQLYILSTGLDFSYGNFPSQLLFSPIMHGVASKRRNDNQLYYTLGETKVINLTTGNIAAGDNPFTLISSTTGQEIIPGQKFNNNTLTLDMGNIELQNDFYQLRNIDTTTHVLAFNFNRDESEMIFYNTSQIEEICSKSGLKNYKVFDITDPGYKEVINALQKESDFWKLFIIFALFTLLFEIFVLRFWKG